MTLVPPPPQTERPSALRVARELRGWTVQDFAALLGVDPTHVSKIERQRELPWPKFRRDAARVLGVDERVLFE